MTTNLPRKPIHIFFTCITIIAIIFSRYSYVQYYHKSDTIAWGVTSPTKPDKNAQGMIPLRGQPFPKKIWQSWKDDSEDPTERTVGFPHQWRITNPSHRYERITDDNSNAYVHEHFPPGTSSLFSNITDPILQADFLRYLIMLGEGGVWADIDVLPHQPVSTWIPEDFQASTNLVVGIENDHQKRPIWDGVPYSVQLSQYTILAKPKHPVFVALVHEVTKNIEGLLQSKVPGEGITFKDVMVNTGPFVYTKVLMDHFTKLTGVKHTGDELSNLQEPKLIGDVLVLPKHAFGWLSNDHTPQKGDSRILVEHLFIGSWREGHPG